ncbi:MAG: DUF86 domain-containing protein [Cyanobacteria bacterium]|nr:DUF86 domain-containing protein [Cyanobacteriota bacterium]
MVDRDLVNRRRVALAQYLRELREVTAAGREAYLADWRAQRTAERSLHLATEACLDLAEHVIADRRLRAPDTAAEVFAILRDAALLAAPLAEALARMARFRNLLVHDYVRLDAGKVFDIATNDTPDLERFSEIVGGLI